jgi:hypothetical protein
MEESMTTTWAGTESLRPLLQPLDGLRTDPRNALAAQLARFRRARVVVSYYDHPEVRRLYAGWTIRPISSARKNLVHSARNGKLGREVAPEILIMNGPSLVQASLLETSHDDR